MNVFQHSIEQLQSLGNINRHRIFIFKDFAIGMRECAFNFVVSVNNNLLEVSSESTGMYTENTLYAYQYLLQYIENSFTSLSQDKHILELIQPVVSIQTSHPKVVEWLKSKGFTPSNRGIWLDGEVWQKRYFTTQTNTTKSSSDINLNIRLIQ